MAAAMARPTVDSMAAAKVAWMDNDSAEMTAASMVDSMAASKAVSMVGSTASSMAGKMAASMVAQTELEKAC